MFWIVLELPDGAYIILTYFVNCLSYSGSTNHLGIKMGDMALPPKASTLRCLDRRGERVDGVFEFSGHCDFQKSGSPRESRWQNFFRCTHNCSKNVILLDVYPSSTKRIYILVIFSVFNWCHHHKSSAWKDTESIVSHGSHHNPWVIHH